MITLLTILHDFQRIIFNFCVYYLSRCLLSCKASTRSYPKASYPYSTSKSSSYSYLVCPKSTSKIWDATRSTTNTPLTHCRSNGSGALSNPLTKKTRRNSCSSSPARLKCLCKASPNSRAWTDRRSFKYTVMIVTRRVCRVLTPASTSLTCPLTKTTKSCALWCSWRSESAPQASVWLKHAHTTTLRIEGETTKNAFF